SEIIVGAPQFFVKDTLYVSKETMIALKSNDAQSGVKTLEYALDNGPRKTYDKFSIPTTGTHSISFSAMDNVNNKEESQTSIIFVDNEPPEIYINFSVLPIGKKGDLDVYPNY